MFNIIPFTDSSTLKYVEAVVTLSKSCHSINNERVRRGGRGVIRTGKRAPLCYFEIGGSAPLLFTCWKPPTSVDELITKEERKQDKTDGKRGKGGRKMKLKAISVSCSLSFLLSLCTCPRNWSAVNRWELNQEPCQNIDIPFILERAINA